ncbi:MAG: hypothetical protein WDW38_000361 [Sanguina aurantia]
MTEPLSRDGGSNARLNGAPLLMHQRQGTNPTTGRAGPSRPRSLIHDQIQGMALLTDSWRELPAPGAGAAHRQAPPAAATAAQLQSPAEAPQRIAHNHNSHTTATNRNNNGSNDPPHSCTVIMEGLLSRQPEVRVTAGFCSTTPQAASMSLSPHIANRSSSASRTSIVQQRQAHQQQQQRCLIGTQARRNTASAAEHTALSNFSCTHTRGSADPTSSNSTHSVSGDEQQTKLRSCSASLTGCISDRQSLSSTSSLSSTAAAAAVRVAPGREGGKACCAESPRQGHALLRLPLGSPPLAQLQPVGSGGCSSADSTLGKRMPLLHSMVAQSQGDSGTREVRMSAVRFGRGGSRLPPLPAHAAEDPVPGVAAQSGSSCSCSSGNSRTSCDLSCLADAEPLPLPPSSVNAAATHHSQRSASQSRNTTAVIIPTAHNVIPPRPHSGSPVPQQRSAPPPGSSRFWPRAGQHDGNHPGSSSAPDLGLNAAHDDGTDDQGPGGGSGCSSHQCTPRPARRPRPNQTLAQPCSPSATPRHASSAGRGGQEGRATCEPAAREGGSGAGGGKLHLSSSGPHHASMSPRPPQRRVWHPAVLCTPSLLRLCATPDLEVLLDATGRAYPSLLPPVFPGAYPSISFAGTAEQRQAAGLHPLTSLRLTVRYGGIANSPVKAAFASAGFRPTQGPGWLVLWGSVLDAAGFAGLSQFQRVNHFPGTWELGRKDYLYRNVYNSMRSKGPAFDIVPQFFLLPRDYDEFQADLARNPKRMYIQKPVNSSRGRGVRMVTRPADVPRDLKDVLLQRYIHNPLLVNGLKFDMRVYVAVTCVDPLRIYVYEEGLARFATQAYSRDTADLKKRGVHLTNFSLNKRAVPALPNQSPHESDSAGCKWSLTALREHLTAEGRACWEDVWQQVHDLAAKAVISVEQKINTEVKMKVPHRWGKGGGSFPGCRYQQNLCGRGCRTATIGGKKSCFSPTGLSLLQGAAHNGGRRFAGTCALRCGGFDILLDASATCWLIEANTCPSLAGDSPLDRRVKLAMVKDLMHMSPCITIAFPPPPAAPVPVGLPVEDLPLIVVESEAELCRCRGWQRVLPCITQPSRYSQLFDTQRLSNVLLAKYYSHLQRTAQKRPGASHVGAQ